VQRQWAAATYLNKEFGVIDDGLTAGTGTFSLNGFFEYVDRAHNAGNKINYGILICRKTCHFSSYYK
jgi:hypothetical protein